MGKCDMDGGWWMVDGELEIGNREFVDLYSKLKTKNSYVNHNIHVPLSLLPLIHFTKHSSYYIFIIVP